MHHRSGFTLIELLVVIAIIAVLAVVVVLTLNPAGLLQESRDGNRLSDMATLNSAISYSLGDNSAESLGSPNTVYVSIPDPTATTTAGDQCQGLGLPSLPAGWGYQCASSGTYRLTNGTGWIPVNLSNNTFGSSLAQLPIDSVNTTSTGLYYTYVSNGTQWELLAQPESSKYISIAKASAVPGYLVQGSNISLLVPYNLGLVGYWTFDEGTGTTEYDSSGNADNLIIQNGSPTWVAGKIGGGLQFSGAQWVGTSTSNGLPLGSSTRTVSAWFKLNATGQNGNELLGYGSNSAGNRFGMWIGTAAGCTNNSVGVESVGQANQFSWNEDTNWHYLALVLPAGATNISQALLYFDGSQQTPCSTGAVILNTQNTEFLIGAVPLAHAAFANASIDDVRIYNRALSAIDIKTLYNAQK